MVQALTSQEYATQVSQEAAAKRLNAKPKPVEPSKKDAIELNSAMQQMIKMVKADIDEILMPQLRKLAPEYQTDGAILTTDNYIDDITKTLSQLAAKWSSPTINKTATSISDLFIRSAAGVNRRRFNKSMKSFGLDIFGDSPQVDTLLQASTWENAQLIKSIPSQYLENVQSSVMTNVRAGNRPSAMEKQLREQFGVTKNRAKFIARDQTAKLNGDLTKERQKSAGFDYFQWVDSDDERVRKRHRDIENKVTAYGKGIYRWDNPPLSSKGTPIIPSQDYNCRCIAKPISNAQVEQNQIDGDVKKGVKR